MLFKCEICGCNFDHKSLKKTCSKVCKNLLARKITQAQFSDPAAREIQRQISISQKSDPAYKAAHKSGMDIRTKRWQENGHPRTGTVHDLSSKNSIGAANRGRFKGKTWDEIYGKDVADKRRKQNSRTMSKRNEILLKDRRSSLEDILIPYLPGYSNNIQIGRYTVDFVNHETMHIVEVHGDYWHCNPKIYEASFYHTHIKMTALEKWNYDSKRTLYLESKGFSVTIVWESDIKEFIKGLK